MSKSANNISDVGSIYATFWRMIYMTVHRYDSNPTGELLTVMTIALLDKAGYHPTISDLVKITGLQQTSVSRYVSRQIRTGYMTEVVDPEDRRRRRLVPTSKGTEEEKWHEDQTLKMARMSSEALSGLGESKDPVADMIKILLGVGEDSPASK
jgi:DNA-binding MarR family transcriptional regulator